MLTRPFSPFGTASALTLGGGGIGLVWGETTREEAAATIRAAIDGGIDVLDTAPMYGQCESLIAEVFSGKLPNGVRITTKCGLGTPPRGEAAKRLDASLSASLAAMRVDRVDILFLHSNICADEYVYANRPDIQDRQATRWATYRDEVVPAMQALQASGRIGAWGITGVGVPATIVAALEADAKPAFVQVVTNLLDSAGGLRRYAEPAEPRRVLAAANAAGVTVLGIRAVQAGALTDDFDRPISANHPERADYDRAASFRTWCKQRGDNVAEVAHRYALSIPGVASIVLGVKNRAELADCLRAAERGPLDAVTLGAIDGLGLRR